MGTVIISLGVQFSEGTAMTKIQWTDEKHGNAWKGGRSIASNGYVLIHVGREHHLADVRGYTYEHRLVAEEKLGRRLKPDEIVHHIDRNKQNNDPENIEVHRSTAHHLFHHRTTGFNRRLPGEENTTVKCGCGCGESIYKFDNSGRPRRFVSGHNMMVRHVR